MPLPFNKHLDLKLLKLVKDNPILYNVKHAKYLDFDSREVVWHKIGDALNRPAVEFAGIQCQIHFGDFQEDKHKPGFIENLQEYLPVQYSSSWGVEKKFLKAYRKHLGLSPLDAKMLYTKTARDLPTYGVTFFLVKEKQKDKKKLVPRLLGISAQSILRLDEVTKEILQQWPLTHVKSYHVGKSETFLLDFGDYSDKEYCVKTQDAHRIRDILEGYIDLIRRRMLAKHSVLTNESEVIGQDNVEASRGNVMQNVSHNATKLVTESFVGPSQIIQYNQGSEAQQGTQIVTVQQLIVTDQAKNKQEVLKGEVPLRGDMSMDCVRKLNRMNSNSVKIVTLLTDPTDVDVKDAQRIVENMEADLPIVNKGIEATSERQASEEARKMLLDELHDLNNYMLQLADNTKPGHVNAEEAKEAAENIAGLSAQMYFSVDPRTRRRSEILNHSRKSFIACEQTDATIRRASFLAAASTALQTVDTAALALTAEYRGPHLDDEQRETLERSMEDKIGRLNAALALYLMAHGDSKNIDYPAAIDSMNTINELMPELAKDAQILGSGKNPQERAELEEDMRTLFETTRRICALTGTEDHEQMQEASNQYADIAGKLIFTFSRGSNGDKENEIIDLAQDVGEKTSLLLMAANELTSLAEAEPAAQSVDDAGVRAAAAARDLLATAQLTAPAIHEPHCRSALTAAAEALAGTVQQLAAAAKPLLDDPARTQLDQQLHARSMDVAKALDRLKDAYANMHGVGASDVEMIDDSPQQRQRLKFISSATGAKNSLQGAETLWDQTPSSPTEADQLEAQRRLAQMLAQCNAAVAALAAATADCDNPDYSTAELAISTIAELMPQIAKDSAVASSGQDEATRRGMQQQVAALCDASRAICAGAGRPEDLKEAASKFSAASGKLVFLVSPAADKGKEKQIIELSSMAYDNASELVSHVRRLADEAGGGEGARLARRAAQADNCAHALLTAAQVTAPSISEARCQNALISAADQLRNCAGSLAAACGPQLRRRAALQQDLDASHRALDHSLDMLAAAATATSQPSHNGAGEGDPQQERQRLKFISSVSGAKNCLQAAEDKLGQPMVCALMREEDAIALQDGLSHRLARLNAAVAALAAAVADRENPDYVAANEAISTIAELMPQVVQDSRTVGTFNDAAGQAAMVQQVRELCAANRALCEAVGSPEGLSEAVDKFVGASSKLKFLVSPAADKQKENEILDLSALACGRASELLSHVHRLTEQLGGDAAQQLDRRGARAADAAQALLTAAQVTAPNIAEPSCQKALVSAVERLGSSADQLTAACSSHVQQGQPLHADLQDSHRQLHESLRMLTAACQAGAGDHPALREQRRLKFISSVSGANDRLQAAQQQLQQPLERGVSSGAGAAARERLPQRLARLNAAVAALAAALADRENPDYASAERAISTIAELMPQVVEESQTVAATKDGAESAKFMQQVRAMCDAGQEICAGADNPESLGKAAANYATAAGEVAHLADPAADVQKQNQILDLSALACGRASDLLSHVHRLTEQLGGDAAQPLDRRGACAADAAQALLTAAQVTAPSIAEPSCQKALISAVERLGNSADQLTAACSPHVQQGQPLHADLQDSHRQLHESLRMLTDACRCDDNAFPVEEKQRLKFISSVSGANNRLKAAEEQLNKPLAACAMMRAEDAAALRRRLADRLAQLNAAVAALKAATNRDKPDFVAADGAVRTIAELMPQVVQESRSLCSNKDDASQAAMLAQVRALCDAGQAICASAHEPQGLSEATAKFTDASGKLVFLVGPGEPHTKGQGRPGKPVPGKKPPVPVRADQPRGAPPAAGRTHADITQEFLHTLRTEESQDNKTPKVGKETKHPQAPKTDEEKIYQQLDDAMRDADKTITSAEQHLQTLRREGAALSAGPGEYCEQVARTEDRMEDTLAQAGVQVAALVSANYADKMDYKAALQPATNLPKLVNSIVEDGSVVSGSLDERARKAFLDDMLGLCSATKKICDATRNDKEKLNDAAIGFGDKSAKLLRVVSSDANPALEKKLISRAKEIGDAAFRLALEASTVAGSAAGSDSSSDGSGSTLQDICAAGTRCVDAAGKLVYTAKCVAPSIYQSTCQDTLVAAADSLSARLATFSSTWQPLADPSSVRKLTKEADNLEKLLEQLRRDVRAGMLGKRWKTETAVVLDTPLKQMTLKIIDDAQKMSGRGELPAELRKEYSTYARRLADALRALDLANTRCQRAPHDRLKHHQLENAVQELQMMVLQARPKRAGVEPTNVVDLRDFLQEIANGAEQLGDVAARHRTASSKKSMENIKALCATMKSGSEALMAPADNRLGDDTTLDHILHIDVFGQDCDDLIKEMQTAADGITDPKTAALLLSKLAPLEESCNLLRFATRTALSTAEGAAFDAALNDLEEFEGQVVKPLVDARGAHSLVQRRSAVDAQTPRRAAVDAARWTLQAAAGAAGAGDPRLLHRALTDYAVHAACDDTTDNVRLYEHACGVARAVRGVVGAGAAHAATWRARTHRAQHIAPHAQRLVQELNQSPQSVDPVKQESQVQVLNDDDIQKLLLTTEETSVSGTREQLQEKLQQLATKATSISGTIVLSVRKPASLARSLHATADAALQLAAVARALRDNKEPTASQKIEEDAREMCLATYTLLKTSELISHDPDHPNSKRKLLDACRLLNDSINKLVRSAHRSGALSRECGEAARGVQLQQAALQAAPLPAGALPYADCLATLTDQEDLIHKLDGEQAMSREEFMKSMHYVTSAITNSAECGAHCAYLLSVSDTDETVGKEGLVDVPKLHKMVAAAQDSCVAVIRAMHDDEVKEEKKVLEKQVDELLTALDEAPAKTKSAEVKLILKRCRVHLDESAKELCQTVDQNGPRHVTISQAMRVLGDLHGAAGALEQRELVPSAAGAGAGAAAADTQAMCEEVMDHSRTLLTKTQDLIREVRAAPDEPEVMKWVMFTKRKPVIDAFQALLKSIRTNGQRVKLIETVVEETDGVEQKSYIQLQVELVKRWLMKPVVKAEVKTAGKEAVTNIIVIANKMSEDFKGSEKEEMSNLVSETVQLLKECSVKYDPEQSNTLLERVRELQKLVERGVVTRVVEDFMAADAPLHDLDLLADNEKDEAKRKFLLERKIAELLAQLGRVTRTARLLADTGSGGARTAHLNKCSDQTELLAPMLVKAAEERINSPNDMAVIENYKALLAKYSESLAKVRDLCDLSVDPMDFVQTAGETMQRMREESSRDNDPMKCAYTSSAITKLANRVIHVGMSSRSARSDPELARALLAAQQQLSAATPAPDTRASAMPDWKDTTAKILRATGEVESVLGGENIFKKQPEPNQPIYNGALNLHVAIRDWSSRDNEIVAVAKRMAVLMAKLSDFMNRDKQRELLTTSKSIVSESHEVARLAKKLAHECTDIRIKNDLLKACERIPTISGQLKMLTTVKGSSLGHHGTHEDKEAMDMLVGNAQSLMSSIQEVIKGAASASVKIMSQKGPRMKWVRKNYY